MEQSHQKSHQNAPNFKYHHVESQKFPEGKTDPHLEGDISASRTV